MNRRLSVLLLSLPTLASAQRSDALSPAYESVIRRYQSGDREAAIAASAAALEPHVGDGRVTLAASTWIVTATAG